MPKLVIDIETVGEDFDQMDEMTKEALSYWIKKESSNEEEFKVALEELKDGMGFSPLTGKVVAIGVLDVDQGKGAVYFEAPGEELAEFEEGDFKFKPMEEKEMLKSFWEGVRSYDTFITFNGRGFDIPFLIARSAVHKIPITADLMSNRYLGSQRGATHIDLFDQLTFYGSVRKKGSLHLWCRAMGIESPKQEGVKGDDVARLFKEKKFIDIAKYNTRDLLATKELYERWRDYMVY